MSGQLDLFEGVKLAEPEPFTTVKLGRREARIPLRKQRREAIKRLMEILEELEGKDIHIGSYDAGGRHFWLDNLKLPRLQLEWHPTRYKDDQNYIPGVIVLWGSRSACVRIFTDYLVAVREQEYQGYFHYLLDFRNGFWQSQIDNFRSHYACLHITRFKD
ncbi:hypothetical protein X793_03810 [Dehalococcoides mccartyi CG4]|uniref:hypothetical protein n=1 Tax=Dehalococcoides mccartyi TaxID=61435 RepID=UPI0004E06680|nr:hypothetical protein [Dehalococcoides mccartyi]AII59472.1 hypothetical protein X793_03810 [Dehalococcoides mccartyi CG4]